MTARWGLTIPLGELPLSRQLDLFAEAEALGYTDLWSAEVNGTDAFTPLILASQSTERVRLGTAIVSAFTRGPLTLAMHAASLSELAPSRVILGLGAASVPIVAWWNGGKFERPLSRVRDTTEVLRRILAGENVTESLPTLAVRGAKYSRPLESRIPIYLAALRPGMLRLAGQIADGVIINMLAAQDVPQVVKVVRDAAAEAGRNPNSVEVVCRIFVCPTTDRGIAVPFARRFLSGYLTVPTYAKFHDWLGRTELLRPALDAWNTGDRKAAQALLPTELVDDLILSGPYEQCVEKVQEYCRAGVDLPLLQLFDPDQSIDMREAMRAMAPSNARWITA